MGALEDEAITLVGWDKEGGARALCGGTDT